MDAAHHCVVRCFTVSCFENLSEGRGGGGRFSQFLHCLNAGQDSSVTMKAERNPLGGLPSPKSQHVNLIIQFTKDECDSGSEMQVMHRPSSDEPPWY